jgi:hypothetical protein
LEIALSVVGTLAWARYTGGRIGFRDRRELVRLAAVTAALDGPNFVAYRLRTKRRFPDPIDYGSLKAPDTAVAGTAATLLRELAPSFIVNHSLRTYWFSRLMGIAAGVSFDDELLYLAALAHDVGLFSGYSPVTSEAPCFSIRGADWAIGIARKAGWGVGRTDRLAEAVILNLNGRVPASLGMEAHLMMRGVMVDVTAFHAWRINPATLEAVFDALPLLDQRQSLWPMFDAGAERHPDCRGHFATHFLGFGFLMRHSPWRAGPSGSRNEGH